MAYVMGVTVSCHVHQICVSGLVCAPCLSLQGGARSMQHHLVWFSQIACLMSGTFSVLLLATAEYGDPLQAVS